MNRPVLVQDEIIRRLSGLPEPAVLDYFWLVIRRGAVRLDALLQLSKVIIQRPDDWNFRAVRLEHERGTQPRIWHPDVSKCFACGAGHRLFYHHVIEVQHGGSNHPRNQVSLCFRCHQKIHPWLKEPPGLRHGDFESVANVMPRMIDELEHVITRVKGA